ncbi:dTMP kinase [Clostridium sp. D2Q-11]|uniref:Thymidylate kinase n=1 Tax=Anaeromonas frigoriresistens TaxID=2683708 RepID=A0A942Z8H7_9FIRM|nr:dTMP kinase [Anaeromonas frigoriresistens]MBS4537935.1 dTMP kinase [Anaeromonas frigoriresistens]
MKGLFITIEGPDGAGKSTQIEQLKEHFKNQGKDIVITREPGGTEISEKIRDIILDNANTAMADTTEALLYAASRAQHVHQKIIPALKKGKVVICDRFVHSSLVYQGIGRGLGVEEVKAINNFAIEGIKPDVTLFFDISPETALKRKTKNNEGDRLENEKVDFHKRVYEGYKRLIEKYPEEFTIIDANGTIEEIHKEVIKAIG